MSAQEQPISQEWLDNFSGDRSPVVRTLFSTYIKNEPERFAQLGAALQKRDMEQLAYLAHSMKGGAATLGAEPVRIACFAVEQAAKSGDFPLAEEKMVDLEKTMQRTYDFMQSCLDKIGD
ncbi:MAG: Hpt domain-containing protein [Desulfovibrio sp.]